MIFDDPDNQARPEDRRVAQRRVKASCHARKFNSQCYLRRYNPIERSVDEQLTDRLRDFLPGKLENLAYLARKRTKLRTRRFTMTN